MAELKNKVENALNESRTLILGVEILLAFDYESVFMKGFAELSGTAQSLRLFGLSVLLISAVLLIAPAPYHRIAIGGQVKQDLVNFANGTSSLALLFLALGLAVDFYVVLSRTSVSLGLAAALIFLALALFFFFGLEWIARSRNPGQAKEMQKMKPSGEENGQPGGTPLPDRIRQVMTEIRVILPGIQALLGFQFAAVLQESFDQLPAGMKALHFASLAVIAVSTVLLMAAPAYHRIVTQGEDTEDIYHFAGRMVLWSLVFLALGFAGDLFVVVRKVTQSISLAWIAAVLALILCYGVWFGYSSLKRRDRKAAAEG